MLFASIYRKKSRKTIFRQILSSVFVLIVLAGCGSQPSVPPSPSEPVEAESRSVPEPVEPAPVVIKSAAYDLQQKAEVAYATGDWQKAIVTAERGLRIDRRLPELYLVLARSYLAMNEVYRSHQFARQGLQYAPAGSGAVRDALERVLRAKVQ